MPAPQATKAFLYVRFLIRHFLRHFSQFLPEYNVCLNFMKKYLCSPSSSNPVKIRVSKDAMSPSSDATTTISTFFTSELILLKYLLSEFKILYVRTPVLLSDNQCWMSYKTSRSIPILLKLREKSVIILTKSKRSVITRLSSGWFHYQPEILYKAISSC